MMRNVTIGVFVTVLSAFAAAARAELLDLSAQLQVNILQYVDDELSTTTNDTKNVPSGQKDTAEAVLDNSAIVDGDPTAYGTAESFFTDPINPTQLFLIAGFGGELATWSIDPETYQELFGDAFESRSVVVTTAETGVAEGEQALVTGEFFLNGVLALWSLDSDDFSETEILLGFEIELEREDGPTSTVLVGTIEVGGGENGAINITTQGSLATLQMPTLELAGEFPQFERFFVAFFPQILLPYAYEVNVGEEYQLTARLRLKALGNDEGVGVAIAAGESFIRLAETLETVDPDLPGDSIQQRIADEFNSFDPVVEPQSIFDLFSMFDCGMFGFESFGLMGLVGLGGFRTARTRVRRRNAAQSA